MDRIFSVRIDESVLLEMEHVVRRLGLTEREFIESAIRSRLEVFSDRESPDVWTQTLGAWRRKEKPEATLRRARSTWQRTAKRGRRS